LHVAIAIIKKLCKNKDKEHLEKSRCSFLRVLFQRVDLFAVVY